MRSVKRITFWIHNYLIEIHRLGLFRDKEDNPNEFVYTITQYNSSDCSHEQFHLKYQ